MGLLLLLALSTAVACGVLVKEPEKQLDCFSQLPTSGWHFRSLLGFMCKPFSLRAKNDKEHWDFWVIPMHGAWDVFIVWCLGLTSLLGLWTNRILLCWDGFMQNAVRCEQVLGCPSNIRMLYHRRSRTYLWSVIYYMITSTFDPSTADVGPRLKTDEFSKLNGFLIPGFCELAKQVWWLIRVDGGN